MILRKPFHCKQFLVFICFLINGVVLLDAQERINPSGELLYNGIRLPAEWPPGNIDKTNSPIRIPYLETVPEVIPIDVGRQLFVDDFLIETTNLKRAFHYARKSGLNPVLKPETDYELNSGLRPTAVFFKDGAWYDPSDSLFKIWYMAGKDDGTGYAISQDGIHWERPMLDVVKGTNLVLKIREGYRADFGDLKGHIRTGRNGSTVWLDQESKDPGERFKMFQYQRFPGPEGKQDEKGEVYVSTDGIHWKLLGETGPVGDNTSIFYNPFRGKWVFSIRTNKGLRLVAGSGRYYNSRTRDYYEANDFISASRLGDNTPTDKPQLWQRVDSLDLPDKVIGDTTQIYSVDAVAYESIMLGLFMIHRGPDNRICQFGGFPKITDINLGYSRDGFYFSRPDRNSFIPASRKIGTWDRGYIHSAGGCCLIVGDSLYFYYGAWSGESPELKCDMYSGGSIGLATLRRDGFVSMDADENGGYLITRPVTFTGKYLFTNVENPMGELRVEILDENNRIIKPFSKENCIPVRMNKTLHQIRWIPNKDLSSLTNRKVKFKFYLSNGSLYSFWVSPDKSGASYGYVAAGGPGFKGSKDENR